MLQPGDQRLRLLLQLHLELLFGASPSPLFQNPQIHQCNRKLRASSALMLTKAIEGPEASYLFHALSSARKIPGYNVASLHPVVPVWPRSIPAPCALLDPTLGMLNQYSPEELDIQTSPGTDEIPGDIHGSRLTLQTWESAAHQQASTVAFHFPLFSIYNKTQNSF